ncbi:shTK domain protein [Oesophagostomum dentatum]|uniref:ShTK domain protein n=1 Tax=Oesophagostomum dentatum TaxID=61180 RepID=A0A0B1TIA6_OESDE|nr:shTK domain protein [Oesophagostomum dentatum]
MWCNIPFHPVTILCFQYNETATNCGDKLPDKYCTVVFAPGVTVGRNDERPEKCFKFLASPALLSPRLCVRTKSGGQLLQKIVRISADSAKQVSDQIVMKCKCRDIAPYCAKHITICRHSEMLEFARENCKKTCGFCTDDTGKHLPDICGITHECGSHTHCPIWIRNNFCINTYYTLQLRKRYCGKPCRLC